MSTIRVTATNETIRVYDSKRTPKKKLFLKQGWTWDDTDSCWTIACRHNAGDWVSWLMHTVYDFRHEVIVTRDCKPTCTATPDQKRIGYCADCLFRHCDDCEARDCTCSGSYICHGRIYCYGEHDLWLQEDRYAR